MTMQSFASRSAWLSASVLLVATAAAQGAHESMPTADAIYPDLERLYLDLHQNPELSWHEEKTAAKMAAQLRSLGYDVTTGVGKIGVVGLLRNGKGPTVMLRTELDALPMEEKTGVPYASKAVMKNDAGENVNVMHACGHDIHMTSWVGAATLLARSKDQWRGTVMMVAQPAEEVAAGAAAMIADGLFTRFPRPDFALAVHDIGSLPSGQVGVVPGFAFASMDTVDITIYGKGAHGAAPHRSIDPVLIAAKTVVALHNIVSREIDPLDPAVITVGSIHAGTKSNIIPDQAKLQITVRSYKDEVQKQLLSAIARVTKGEALAAGATKEPLVVVDPHGTTHSTFNDEVLTKRLASVLSRTIGEGNVVPFPQVMGSEDFSEYGHAGVPAVLFWIGATEPATFAALKAKGMAPPSNHSSLFAPDRERTIRTGVTVLTAGAMDLLAKP